MMHLKILLPTEIFLDREVEKVVAEAVNGSFCLKPRHIDFVTALEPGILSYSDSTGNETFVAVDRGALIKYGSEVLVSVANAVMGPDLGSLQRTVEEEFMVQDEKERLARTAVAKMEANFVRQFMQFER